MKILQKNNIICANNVGYIDAAIRLVLGVVAIAALVVFSKDGMSYWLATITLLSVYPLLTSFCFWDPLYDLTGFSTNKDGSMDVASIDNFLSQSFQYFQAESGRASNDSTNYDAAYMSDKDRAA